MALNLSEYLYSLPQERIALYPLEKRDQSKLLVYRKGNIDNAAFYQLPDFLPPNSFLFFNNTKVIPARLHFQKETGADIEIFLLAPTAPSLLLVETMHATAQCTWQCTIGNQKRWTSGLVLRKQIQDILLEASLLDKEQGLVTFTWTGGRTFAEVIDLAGETPLPPYLKRKAEKSDRDRYQTIYSHHEGAVAAPTAGLHFTEAVFNTLKEKNIHHDFVTLHVSAGTFQPIKTDNINEHKMHQEQIVLSRTNVENILKNNFIVAVGTTSMRTLESLYWFGVKLFTEKQADDFKIEQNAPYRQTYEYAKEQSLKAVLAYMDENQKETLIGETSIFIKPGYRFKVCNALITNFHQPGSTLILLVAAFVGENWKRIYEEALRKNYRFLSYGDSSLLIP